MKYHPFINGLRAVAVIPVILFHFSTGLFSGGYAGVDVFFVISGYLITGLLMDMLEKKNFSLLAFYERRARRILPALFLMCFLCLAFCWVYFMPEDFKLFGRSLIGAALFGTNFTFLEDVGYFASPALVKPLLHTWSLAVEEQFYVIYPVLLYGLYKWSGKNRKKLVAGVAAVFAVSLALNVALIWRQPDATFYLLHTRAWELLAGALVFLYLQDVRIKGNVAEAAGITGLALLFFSFTFYDRGTPFPGPAAILPVLGTVLVLWPNLHARTLSGQILAYKPVVAVGLVSYALYLYHWPILVFSRYYLERDLNATETLLAFALTGALATLSYVALEQPIRDRKWLVPRRAIFSFSLAGLLLVGLIGTAGTKMDGFPGRFSGAVLKYVTDDTAPPIPCEAVGKDHGDRAQLCKLGDVQKPQTDFILWGDSHADKISPGLDAFAKQRGLSGWGTWSPGCPPVVGLDRVGEEKYKCRVLNARALDFIRNKKIKTVIMVSRWDVILHKEAGSFEDIRGAKGPRVELVMKDGSKLYDVPAFSEAFHETIAALKGMGVHVWVVKQVPAHLQYLSSALGKYTLLGRDTGDLNRPIGQVLLRRAPVDGVFDAMHDPDVTFVDTLKKFCPDGKTCLAAANGRSLYSDDTHVSVYGALWLKDMWTQIFPR